MAGLGDRAAAKATHRDASPGLRLRTKAHSPLPPPPEQKPLRLRPAPLSIALTHRKNRGHPLLTHRHQTPLNPHATPPSPASASRVTGASQCPGHKTASTRTYELPSLQSSQSPLLPRPRPPRSLLTGYTGKRREQSAPKSLPPHWSNCGPRAPPLLATAGDPFMQLTLHWLKPGTARSFVVMELGTPSPPQPPQHPFPTELAGRAPPPLRAQTPGGD